MSAILVRTGAREVRFYLDIDFLSQYELEIEIFEKGKPFTTKIVDDLLNYVNKKYGLGFDESDTPKAVYVVEDRVVMVYYVSIPFIWVWVFYHKIRCWKNEDCSNRKCNYWQYCEHNYVERKKDELGLRKQMLSYNKML